MGKLKCNNILITRVTEGEESEQGLENVFEEILAENTPNLVKEKGKQVQNAQRDPSKKNSKRSTPRHIIIEMPKVKTKRESFYISPNFSFFEEINPMSTLP